MLSLSEIHKRYGATRALDGVTLDEGRGAVLGLVGENGAGKSTLLKIAGGAVAPDSGRITLDGGVIAPRSPRDAQAHGIWSVFQELTLLGDLTVEQNLFLTGAPCRGWGVIDRRAVRASASDLLSEHNLEVAPEARVCDLPLGRKQMLEIVRAVSRSPRVLLLDEATSALGAAEVEWLRAMIERLRRRGVVILFISHRWDEVVQFCDRVAVLRNGELVGVGATADLSEAEAVRLMTGQSAGGEAFPPKAAPREEVLVRAANLTSPSLAGVDLTLRAGEILGLGGLVGQGQGPLLEALFGAHRLDSGDIRLRGAEAPRLTPRRAIKAGLAYVPQERKTQGLLLAKTVGQNLTLAILDRLRTLLGFLDGAAERRIAEAAIEREKIRTRGPGERVMNLSGGNQQKVLLERWLLTRPAVLLLNDVTRGVDVGAKRHIYGVVAAAAREGVGVIWYSTDARELVGVAHRVLVMLGGGVAAELEGSDLTPDRIVQAAVLGGGAR
jgi:ribose transport system ATP-binding protein